MKASQPRSRSKNRKPEYYHWRRRESKLAGMFPETGDIFLDVGANIGEWTKPLAQTYNQVIAVEPDHRAILTLLEGLPKNVRIFERAAWNKTNGRLKLQGYKDPAHSTAFKALQEERGEAKDKFEVSTITVDSLFWKTQPQGKIDLIKIDTEGAECQVLDGARKTIAKHKPCLVIEAHVERDRNRIRAMLKEMGYRIEEVFARKLSHVHREDHVWMVGKPKIRKKDL